MLVKNEHCWPRVAFAAINYGDDQREHRMIYASGGKILALQSLRRIAEVLPPARFARIPKSYIVALSRIEHVKRGKMPVAGRRLPIGDTYRDAFTALIRPQNLLSAVRTSAGRQ